MFTKLSPGSSRSQDLRSALGNDEPRQKPPGFRENSVASQSSVQDTTAQSSEGRNPLGAIGNDAPTGKGTDDNEAQSPAVHDPLAGMAPIDKWGIKGLRTLMNNYPDYSSAITGVDPAHFGLNLQASEYVCLSIFWHRLLIPSQADIKPNLLTLQRHPPQICYPKLPHPGVL
jgi:CCR4-NOT transcription complex subunit 2